MDFDGYLVMAADPDKASEAHIKMKELYEAALSGSEASKVELEKAKERIRTLTETNSKLYLKVVGEPTDNETHERTTEEDIEDFRKALGLITEKE